MNPQILIYGLAPGEVERYTEVLLSTDCQTAEEAERLKKIMAEDGWHSFRVTTWDGKPPNFAKIV